MTKGIFEDFIGMWDNNVSWRICKELIKYYDWTVKNNYNITKLYKYGQNFVKTDCCGKKLNRQYSYPSHYLCNIAILAKASGIKKISAFLVNIP